MDFQWTINNVTKIHLIWMKNIWYLTYKKHSKLKREIACCRASIIKSHLINSNIFYIFLLSFVVYIRYWSLLLQFFYTSCCSLSCFQKLLQTTPFSCLDNMWAFGGGLCSLQNSGLPQTCWNFALEPSTKPFVLWSPR